MLRTTSRTRASKAARRSGVSNEAASVSRLHNISPSGRASARAIEVVGVLAVGQHGKAETLAGQQARHRHVDGAERGALAGLVAVEAEDRLVGHFPKEAELILGERGAERR